MEEKDIAQKLLRELLKKESVLYYRIIEEMRQEKEVYAEYEVFIFDPFFGRQNISFLMASVLAQSVIQINGELRHYSVYRSPFTMEKRIISTATIRLLTYLISKEVFGDFDHCSCQFYGGEDEKGTS